MVANNFMDNEVQKLLGKVRVQMGVFSQRAQAGNLPGFSGRVGWRHVVTRLERAHGFCAAEPFRQHGDKGCIDIVNAAAEVQQGGGGRGLVSHGLHNSLFLSGMVRERCVYKTMTQQAQILP